MGQVRLSGRPARIEEASSGSRLLEDELVGVVQDFELVLEALNEAIDGDLGEVGAGVEGEGASIERASPSVVVKDEKAAGFQEAVAEDRVFEDVGRGVGTIDVDDVEGLEG